MKPHENRSAEIDLDGNGQRDRAATIRADAERSLPAQRARAAHRVSIVLIAALATLPIPALAHECRVVGNPYLRGHYHGDCDEGSETAQGRGEATGADSYVGSFFKGRPDGKGLYTWENGAKLEGTFKAGKANGPGLYISAKGVRYDGRFENGKLNGAAPDDCPVTKGPLTC